MFFPAILDGCICTAFGELIPLAPQPNDRERSESVSGEAEERLMRYFLLTHLCGIRTTMVHSQVQSALMPHS